VTVTAPLVSVVLARAMTAFIMPFFVMTTAIMVAAVARLIYRAIPVIVNKIYRLAAGPVSGTVPSPVLFITRAHVQINRCSGRPGRAHNHNRLGVNHRRGRLIANINAAIQARLVHADKHPDTHIGHGRGGAGQGGKQGNTFHDSGTPWQAKQKELLAR
jgi:hypothetical protein